jgi:hypothetical protein
MKGCLTLFVFSLFALSHGSLARQQKDNHLVVGFTILTPHITGTTKGPKTVIDRTSGQQEGFNDAFRSNALISLCTGLRFDNIRTSFAIRILAVQSARPLFGNDSETEFSARYQIWESGLANLHAILSIKRTSGLPSTDMWFGPYEFPVTYWLPGVGLAVNFSIIHGELQFHGWPRVVVGYAAVPNGQRPFVDPTWYDKEPIYLKYAISLAAGIEFDILGF